MKEDWWLRINGKTIGPLPALRDEIHRKAGVPFYMYSGDSFLERARTAFRREVAEATVKEVKQVRVEQEKQNADLKKRLRQFLEADRLKRGLAAKRLQEQELLPPVDEEPDSSDEPPYDPTWDLEPYKRPTRDPGKPPKK